MSPAPCSELRYSSRWAKWWLALLFVFVVSPFFAAPFLGDEEGVRIAILICAPASYLLLQLVFNKRHVIVDANGVRVRNRPFPGGTGMSVRREDIAHCYVREVVEYNEGQEVDRHYLAGVETKKSGIQDITEPLPSVASARAAACEILAVLNTHPTAAELDVRPASGVTSPTPGWRKAILLWLFLFVGAIALGAYSAIS